ncbi:nucleotide exchange factor GrpE [Actinomycetospora sp. CA-101289]|uniref:nucleotide exchange factor GrpE n=1 Tax=Actinomycetospora sp. CA-101289 TaxID=3239893 RepID=UPI003D993545
MSEHHDPWAIDEAPVPVPDAVAALDLARATAAWSGLIVGRGELESRREAEARKADATLRGLLTDLVGVLDALDRTVGAATGDDPGMTAAVSSTRRRLARVLRRQGVEQVEQTGPVDPETSDIEDAEPHPDLPPETVVRETIAAYRWNGVVLRRGSVIASSGPAGRPAPAPGE